uniref:rRNA N(6)-adenosine-methyltransferase ZCCHC4 n=1 Tax=Tetraodon nigroviridis TaxID=99883 RepID=H3CLE3_TETNG
MDNKAKTEGDSVGIDVIMADVEKSPHCAHGPTLLFEKVSRGGQAGRRFYACSACRDRKDCNFFQWEGEKVSEARRLAREAEIRSKRPRFSHAEFSARLRRFLSIPEEQRSFCQDCELLQLPGEEQEHASHRRCPLSAAQLARPSQLLRPLDNKKSNAQFLFTQRSSHFLLESLVALGYRKLLCVGTPRLQEMIKLRNLEHPGDPVQSLLLDMDFRYAQFYSQEEFCHYNMFNHHFFEGQASRTLLQTFLEESGGRRAVVVADPPFGGLVKPLANTFSLLSHMWRQAQNAGMTGPNVPLVWIFPYFLEPRIQECLPSLTMLDYQVEYDNHPLYKRGETARTRSPVRIFTNIPARDFVLPEEEGYRFCPMCQRFVWILNKHCDRCRSCPSKDGRKWKHCSACGKCVKAAWTHCSTCGRCVLPPHLCG